MSDDALVTRSAYAFAETRERLIRAIAAAGATLFANIDQQTAAQSVGLALRPTVLLLFGNPKAGTPLMQAYPLAALDLPLKVLLWEADAAVYVAHTPLAALARRYDIPEQEPMLAGLERAIAAIVGQVSA